MLDVLYEHLQCREHERDADDRDEQDQPDREGDSESTQCDRLPGDAQHRENREIACKLQHERRGDRREDDELVRERDLADHARIAGEADGAALQRLLCRKPGPQRDGDERKEASAGESGGAKDVREDEVVNAKQRERRQQRPREAGDAAEVARRQLAPEEVDEQRAVARDARIRERADGCRTGGGALAHDALAPRDVIAISAGAFARAARGTPSGRRD